MKKFLLSILCFVAVATAANADVVAFVADGATYGGEGVATTIANNSDGNILGTTYTSAACDIAFTQVNSNKSNVNSGGHVRWYQGDIMTITPANGATITNVVFKTTSGSYVKDLTASTGTVTTSSDDATITWTGSTTDAFTLTTPAQVRFYYMEVTYTAGVASSVASPTFSVEAGTYGEKQSIELACEAEGAVIYYTLDGTNPDKTSTLYESAIELNTKTTVKAIAYVGDEASNVASATYDFFLDCELTWNANSPAIQATTMQANTNFVSPLGNTGAKYWITYDGSEPSAENGKSNYQSAKFNMYTDKKDTVVTVKIRPEKDGIYGATLERTFYFAYAPSLTAYKGITEMAAGNYVMSAEGTIARTLEGTYTYGYLPTVEATSAAGMTSAIPFFEWTFEATDGGYYIKDSQGRYIYQKGTYNSFNISTTVPTEGGVWTVTINSDGTAQIMNVDKQKYIQYSTSHDSWGSYPDEEGTMPVLGAAYVPEVTMTPAAGSSVETVSKITFSCPDGIAAGSKYYYCSLQGTSSTTGVSSTNQVDDNTVEFILDSEVTTAGDYTFVLYKEALTLAPNTLAQKYPAATENYTITITGGAAAATLEVTPEGDSYQKSLQHFTFTYAEGIYVNGLFGGEAPFLGYTDPATGNSSKITLTATTSTATSVTLSTDAEQTAEGYYTLMVPAEYFVLADSKPNDMIMKQYMVSATNPNAINIVTVTPEEGPVTELSNIVVSTDTDLNGAPNNWTITDELGTSYTFKVTNNDIDGDGIYNDIKIALNTPITDFGTYTLTIPAGSLTQYGGSKTIDEQTIVWTIEAPAATITPAAGEVTSLQHFTFTYEGGIALNENYSFPLQPFLSVGSDRKSLTVTNTTETSITLSTAEEYTAAGTYQLNIFPGYFILGGTTQNETILNTYTIAGVEVIEFKSVTPAEGVVTELSRIEVETDTDLDVTVGAMTLVDANGNTYEIANATTNDNDDTGIYNYINITLGQTITAAGTYTLTIPAGTVVEYGGTKSNAETTYTWTIEAPAEPFNFVSVTPEEGTVTELKEIVVMADVEIDVAPTTWTLTDANGTSYEFNATVPATYGYKGVKLNLGTAITADGTYTLTIPAGSIKEYQGTKVNPEATYTWTIDATAGGGEEIDPADYILNPADLTEADFTANVTHGLYTVVRNGKDWVADTSNSRFSRDPEVKYTHRIKPGGKANYWTFDAPSAGTLYVNARPSSKDATDRNMVATQGETELYNEFVTDATVEHDEYTVYKTHEIVIPAAGLVTVTNPVNAINYHYIEFVPAAEPEPTTGVVWSIEEGAVLSEFSSVDITFNIEGVETAKAKSSYSNFIFYEKDAEGNYNLTENYASAGYMNTSASGNTVTFSLELANYSGADDVAFSRSGDYRIVIPVGSIKFNNDNANLNTEEYVLNFSIEGAPAPEEVEAVVTADPENNSTVSEIREVVITFTEHTAVTVAEPDFATGRNIPQATITDPDFGMTMPAGYMMFRAGTAANQLVLYVDPAYTGGMESFAVEGDYAINIPAGVVTFSDNNINAAFTLNYTVSASVTPEPSTDVVWSIEEGTVLSEFSSVDITFNIEGVETAKAKSSYSNFIFYEKDAEGNYNLTENGGSAGYMNTSASGNTVTFSLELANYSGYDGVAFSRSGDYRIVIPVGSIKFNNDNANLNTEEYVLNFTIVGAPAPEEVEAVVTADPENNSTVSEIREVVITFTEHTAVTVAEPDFVTGRNIPQATVTDPDFGMTMPAGYMMFRAGEAANELVVYVDPAYTGGMESFAVAGDYTINIPAGIVTFSDNNINAAFTLNYTVEAAAEAIVPTFTANPENNSTVTELKEVILTFDDYTEITLAEPDLDEATNVPEVYINDPENGAMLINYMVFAPGAEANQMRLYVDPELCGIESFFNAGTYTIKVPAGIITFSDGVNAEFTLNYTVNPVEYSVYAVTTYPEANSSVETLFEVTIEFNVDEVAVNVEGAYASVYDEYDDLLSSADVKYTDAVGTALPANTLTFVINTPVAFETTVYFVLPACSVCDANNPSAMNDEIRIMYNVTGKSGINGIEADPVNGYVVYDLNGYLVMQTKKAADLERLHNGIYIINGVKVLINK